MTNTATKSGWLTRLASTAARTAVNLIDDARPVRPNPALFAQGQSFQDFLLPEDSTRISFGGLKQDVSLFLMKDGALGVGLWLRPIAHELLDEYALTTRLDGLSKALAKAGGGGRVEGLSFQLIFDAEPDLDPAPVPAAPRAMFAGFLAAERASFLSCMAAEPRGGLRLFKRRILLCVRLEGKTPLGPLGREEAHATRAFARRVQVLSEALSTLRAGLLHAHLLPRFLEREELLMFLRDSLHGISMRVASRARHTLPSNAGRPLGEQGLYHPLEITPFALGVGADTWQAASLLEAPEATSLGGLVRTLEISVPHRIIVNMRPVQKGGALSFKRAVMAHARDVQGIRMREDLDELDERIQSDEGLFAFSWHMLVRNEGVTLARLADETRGEEGALRETASKVTALLGAMVREERHCAPLVFASCLPFQNDPALVSLVGREMLMPSKSLASLLPVFGGFRGTASPMLQMVSRAGERVYLNPRDSAGASHLAVLGGTGAGKSFFVSNLVSSFLARHPQGRVFIIDKKTSYGVLARLAAEEATSAFLRPPANFPNIFALGCDEESLPSLVGILHTAITLVSPRADLSAMETSVLGEAIRMTFAEKERQAAQDFSEARGGLVAKESPALPETPRLSEVVANLFPAANALDLPAAVATRLSEWLSPFVGSGPYARFLDAPAEPGEGEVGAPMITLCDLDGVAGDPILLVLTVQALVLDILRRVRPKDEFTPNPPSLLIVEEVGVLAGESPALVSFIRDAWKTMRKYGVTCVGVTNSVSDFAEQAGPREIWSVSPNKIIMPQNPEAVRDMAIRIREGRNGLVPTEYHCDVLASLSIVKGEYSDGLWMSPETQGTYSYLPTGYDYWCAASDPSELATVARVVRALDGRVKKPVLAAVIALARLFPSGIREAGAVRVANEDEFARVVAAAVEFAPCEEEAS